MKRVRRFWTLWSFVGARAPLGRVDTETDQRTVIALDAMGGDHAPEATIDGAILAVERLGVVVTLFGDESTLRPLIAKRKVDPALLTIVHAPETIGMDEHAGAAVRRRWQTSMQLVVDAVKRGDASAGVSAGNSGAFFAAGLFTLGRIPGVDRPALATVFPTIQGVSLLLDVGANVECKAQQLVEFAHMGSVYAERILGIERPRIGLLSNGEEATKGPREVQEAHAILSRSSLHFIGNVEGKDVPRGVADVVVCDGYAGNVLIKTAEGTAETIVSLLREELTRTLVRRMLAAALRPAFRALRSRMDYAEYGGAVLLGLRGPLIVAHGRSNARAIANAVRVARDAARRHVTSALQEGVELSVARGTSATQPGS